MILSLNLIYLTLHFLKKERGRRPAAALIKTVDDLGDFQLCVDLGGDLLEAALAVERAEVFGKGQRASCFQPVAAVCGSMSWTMRSAKSRAWSPTVWAC